MLNFRPAMVSSQLVRRILNRSIGATVETASTRTVDNNPTGATHPRILMKMSPDGNAALAQMDPSYAESGSRDLEKLYPFKRSGKTFVCMHHQTGEELDINEANARKYIAQLGAAQWMRLYNLMQAFFIHQSGPKKGWQKTTVSLSVDDGSKHEFHDLDSAISFLGDMQEEWEVWGKGT